MPARWRRSTPNGPLQINPALLKRQYYQPRWQMRSGQVMACERVLLYGLTLADKRLVHYGPIAPAEARARSSSATALVACNLRPLPPFLKHNQRQVRELEELESRTRRRDILVDEQVLFDFTHSACRRTSTRPAACAAGCSAIAKRKAGLRLAREDLLARDPGAQLGDQYPDHLDWEDMRFRLSYQFEPGGEADGVSVTVPVALLNRVPRHLFAWLVPGMLRESALPW